MRLATRMDDRNYIFFDLTTLAVEIKRTCQYTSGAIARLVDHGMIHRGPKVGRSWTYRLDPHLGWRGGDIEGRRKAMKEAETRWFGAVQVPRAGNTGGGATNAWDIPILERRALVTVGRLVWWLAPPNGVAG